MVASVCHINRKHGCNKGFTYSSLSADYAYYLFNAAFFVQWFYHTFLVLC